MKPTIYIETTIVSYIAARPSRQPFLLGCQRMTRKWWREKRREYEFFTSPTVIDEASCGNSVAAKKRLGLLRRLGQLHPNEDALKIATSLLAAGIIPAKAEGDALHVAIAAVHGMDYLLTWNCKHLANIKLRVRFARALEERGYSMPEIVTPIQLDALEP